METESSLPCTQQPPAGPYLYPDEYSSQGFILLLLTSTLILSYYVHSRFQSYGIPTKLVHEIIYLPLSPK
jgi:hypothetical protein